MWWQPCQGLRSCVLHHPPMVTFFLCVVTLGFTYLSLGVYIKTQPVRDIDFTQDWGDILQAVSVGKVCARGNSSRRKTTVEGTRTVNPEDSANVNALVTFTVSPWQLAVNHSSLQIIATGTQLGMRGQFGWQTCPGEDTPLTFSLTPYWWSIQCNGSEAECTVKYCVSLTGPRDLLPQSRY
ncbi:PREDICTED: transmembrane protein 248-like [Nanorana parkeri]|uniref:transmembrane protein 248-like n=1 Tax=Nanorana parkeri TaxID=125878 RepID=UPI00085492ED|nr:PREDICTED: transmembrane protein 248-like [Nanorana parkeri]